MKSRSLPHAFSTLVLGTSLIASSSAVANVLFQDDFELGARPEWRFDTTSQCPGGGCSWDDSGGELCMTADGCGVWSHASVGDDTWTNYAVMVDMRLEEGDAVNRVVSLYESEDHSNRITVNLRASYRGDGGMLFVTLGDNNVIHQVHYPNEHKQILRLRAAIYETLMQIDVDGLPVAVVDLEPYTKEGTAPTSGRVTLTAVSGGCVETKACFDNVVVEQLERLPRDLLSIDVGERGGAQGVKVAVPVSVSLLGAAATMSNRPLAGVDLRMSWDPGFAELLEVSRTEATSDWFLEWNAGVTGVDIAMISATGLNVLPEAIDMLELDFQFLADAGETVLEVVDVLAVDRERESFLVIPSAGALYTECFKGDVDQDGSVDTADALLGLDIAVGNHEPTESERCSADMNNDGTIASGDVILVLRKAVESKRQGTPAGTPAVALLPGETRDVALLSVEGAAGFDLDLVVEGAGIRVEDVRLEGGAGILAHRAVSSDHLSLAFAGLQAQRVLIRLQMDIERSGFLGISGVTAYDPDGRPVRASVPEGNLVLGADPSSKVVLHPLAPNPFNPATRISFVLNEPGDATVEILDPAGRLVRRLVLRGLPRGNTALTWDGKDRRGVAVASGVYFVALEALGERRTARAALLR